MEDQIKTNLLWNSLIFHLYRDKLIINIEEQSLSVLNLINQSKDFFNLIKDPTTSQ